MSREKLRIEPAGRAPGPGQVLPPVLLMRDEALELYRVEFAVAACAADGQPGPLVWVDGENELLVHAGQVRLEMRDGFALVGIPVFCEQTGDVEVVVTFALGRPDALLGLIMAAEDRPRGPAEIVDAWGDQLTATAWRALISMAAEIAAAAGVDDENRPLLPAALAASAETIAVLPQARHVFDRRQDGHHR